MDNRYSGKVDLEIAGRKHVLHFTWEALAKLKTEFGSDYNGVIGRACLEGDPDVLARALACGLSPAVGFDEIRAASPPLFYAAAKVDTALKYAYFGSLEVPRVAENPHQHPKGILSRLLSLLPFGWGSSRASSGG